MLSYDGKKVVPAPVVTINKSYRRTDDGTKIGVVYDITLTGTLLPFKGSPQSNKTFWTATGYPPDEAYEGNNEDFHHIIRKQEALRSLFSVDGKSLEWQPSNGQPVVKCNPRIADLSFAEGNWAEKCDYVVRCQADWIYLNGTLSKEDQFAAELVVSAGESWTFEEVEGQRGLAHRVTHEITAQGVTGFDSTGALKGGKESWQHARDWCIARVLGGSVPEWIVTSTVGGSAWHGGGYTKSYHVDRTGGSYGITEEWLITNTDTYIEKSYSLEYDRERDEYRVRCEGLVHGFAGDAGSVQALQYAKQAVPQPTSLVPEVTALFNDWLEGKSLGDIDGKSLAFNPVDSTARFVYEWTSSENQKYTIIYEASSSYNPENRTANLACTVTIEGKGKDSADRLANAQTGIPSDSQAQTKALSLAPLSLPVGVAIGQSVRSRSKTVNERAGRVSLTLTWDSAKANFQETTVTTQGGGAVVAVIPIPGRSAGPIIQNMGTKNESITTVSFRARGCTSKPSGPSTSSSYGTLIEDVESWTQETGVYERTQRYIREM